MYTEFDESGKAIGDIDVVFHDGLHHLFHLVLPNHDCIAHAISTNGINWRRVNNALFIGDPGSWDDLMLWTMHVSPDPYQTRRWRMFYTGLSRREKGRVQRVGLAVSDDLFHWRKAPVHWQDSRGPKDPKPIKKARETCKLDLATRLNAEVDSSSSFPLEPDGEHYESTTDDDARNVNFRDPFFFRQGDQGWLLVAGRVKEGPINRRGCVCWLKESSPNVFESLPALYHPGNYDDVEVPNLVRLGDQYYLIGSVRQDARICYWQTDKLGPSWTNSHDNVLLPHGNYAGRICRDGQGWLIWSFFSIDQSDRTSRNVLPPPKRLVQTDDGLLRATTYEEFENWLKGPIDTTCLHGLSQGSDQLRCDVADGCVELQNDSGFQAFVFDESIDSFRFRATLKSLGSGKCGIVFRVDPQTHDGYYLSLDLQRGIAQLRVWKPELSASGAEMMQFEVLQTGSWQSETPDKANIQLLGFGSYLELSIDDRVVLSLVDQSYSEGLLGVYLESARIELTNIRVHHMRSPSQSDEHLVVG